MFTLKLYRRDPETGRPVAQVEEERTRPGEPWLTEFHEVVRVQSFKIAPRTLEVRAIAANGSYASYYVGERTKDLTAINDDNHFDWGLLENSTSKTTEHFRPHSYG